MAKARSIGGIYAELTLRDGKFKAGLKASAVALKRFGAASAQYAAAGASIATAASGTALLAGTKRTLNQVDAIADLSAQTGVAVADMMKLQLAYRDGGRAAEMAGKDIGKMQKSIVGAAGGGKDPFASLGLSAQALLDLNPADQFSQIGAAIMRIQNPAERTAKAMEIFGKGGMGLMTVFEGLPAAEKSLGSMPELAQRFAGAMGEANDLIGHLSVKSDQFYTGFTAGVIGEILPHLRMIDEFDFTQIGQNLGKSLSMAFQSITDGSIWELFQLHGEKAILSIQGSQAMNDWAASANALFDRLFGFSEDFVASFDHYSAGVDQSNAERIAEIDQKLYDAIDKINMRWLSNSQAAAALSIKDRNTQEPIEVKAETINGPFANYSPPTSNIDFSNEYTRRGLSLDGGNQAAQKAEQGVALMRDMLTVLRRIADTRMTATATF